VPNEGIRQVAGQPDLLLGYPVAIWENLDDVDVTRGSKPTVPIAFGDFRRGYLLADRIGVRVTVDNNITATSSSSFAAANNEWMCTAAYLLRRTWQ
jgi:HK97 family phage major capsid protein